MNVIDLLVRIFIYLIFKKKAVFDFEETGSSRFIDGSIPITARSFAWNGG